MLKAVRAGLMEGLCRRDPQRSAWELAEMQGAFCCCRNMAISILPKFLLF